MPSTCEHMTPEEVRLTIKLMIYAFKQEKDWTLAFQEYTKVTQAAAMTPGTGKIHHLSYMLLQDLKELLDMMAVSLKSGDEPVLAILR
eukprot:CAMPEP_0185597406 /NCGR_PEP_ID=MMETSP0434-20130131/81348_1 /TAXON_ID=626734 ORGANISM="Favella taraikaensis, Strain Fe Narragansett Bay" /NCGR_SAMPLE_ID=MMETSP0434 /ASSEMBLY_ACC=CAM_ASM_000379 /LENGTH=87 /DNA_ID=CAMNT_0028226127 /DNA_START=1717 /DNA_END=1980 /DNA_ORIENTATION=-